LKLTGVTSGQEGSTVRMLTVENCHFPHACHSGFWTQECWQCQCHNDMW